MRTRVAAFGGRRSADQFFAVRSQLVCEDEHERLVDVCRVPLAAGYFFGPCLHDRVGDPCGRHEDLVPDVGRVALRVILRLFSRLLTEDIEEVALEWPLVPRRHGFARDDDRADLGW